MRNFTSISMTLALAVAAGTFTADAARNGKGDFDLSKFQYRHEPTSAFVNSRAKKIDAINAKMWNSERQDAPYREGNPDPYKTFGPTDQIGTLDGPDGEEWYYVSRLDYLEIPPHDNIVYTELILQNYEFEVYDSKMNFVGAIKDKMVYREGETRVVSCEFVPFLSKHFFNSDDNYEVVIGLIINAGEGNNQYRSLVYQLGGEKEDGNDKVLLSYDDIIGDVSEGPSDGSTDNFYVTFLRDVAGEEPSVGDDETEEEELSFWDYLCSLKVKMMVYGKAGATGQPELVYTRELPIGQLQGDQQNVPFMLTLSRDNHLYYVICTYEQQFYNEYDDPIYSDMTMREGNKLNVEFVRVDEDGFKTEYTTSIPVAKNPAENILYSYFSVGSLLYRDDICFDGFNTPEGRAALIVTRMDYTPSSDSEVPSYYVYDHEGNLLHTLFENADSAGALSEVEGCEPQLMFVSYDQYGYMFNFVDLYSAKRVLRFSSQFEIDPDSDPENLTAAIDRVADPDGGYVYVVEMRTPIVIMGEPDANGKTEEIDNRMRFMWINKDGSFRKIDEVSMGKDVKYAQSYILGAAIKPEAFHSDANQEYMILVKRATGTDAAIEELVIGQAISDELPDGNTLLLLGPDDEKGVLNGITPYFEAEQPRLVVTYLGKNGNANVVSADFYALPLDQATVGVKKPSISAAKECGITLDGTTVIADGIINVCNASGMIVVSGNDSVELSGLDAGLYIASCRNGACKILVK